MYELASNRLQKLTIGCPAGQSLPLFPYTKRETGGFRLLPDCSSFHAKSFGGGGRISDRCRGQLANLIEDHLGGNPDIRWRRYDDCASIFECRDLGLGPPALACDNGTRPICSRTDWAVTPISAGVGIMTTPASLSAAILASISSSQRRICAWQKS